MPNMFGPNIPDFLFINSLQNAPWHPCQSSALIARYDTLWIVIGDNFYCIANFVWCFFMTGVIVTGDGLVADVTDTVAIFCRHAV